MDENVISAFMVPNVYLGKIENKEQTKPKNINVIACWNSAVWVKGKEGVMIENKKRGILMKRLCIYTNSKFCESWRLQAFLAEVGKGNGE